MINEHRKNPTQLTNAYSYHLLMLCLNQFAQQSRGFKPSRSSSVQARRRFHMTAVMNITTTSAFPTTNPAAPPPLSLWPLSLQRVHVLVVLVDATHPLLVQLQQLLRDLGRVDGHPQALDVELGDDVFQHLLQRQAAGRPVPGGGRNGILQDGPPQGGQLRGRGGGRKKGKSR